MPDQSSADSVPPIDPTVKYASTPAFTAILNEMNVGQDQLEKRKKLLNNLDDLLSARYGARNRTIIYLLRFGHPRTMMASSDIAPFEATLRSVSGADQINLVLQSPGGDSTIVEKMVAMCRAHLSGNKSRFRVIVPNVAKSAATVLALGADSLLMGYCSELGPIDPQVQIAVSGVIQWVSALAFVESRDKLMAQIAAAAGTGQPIQGLLQQLAGLNIPFTTEMDNHISFAKKTATTLLEKFMLRTRFTDDTERQQKADEIAEKLLSKQLFPVHGHTISGATAKSELGLEVELLEQTDNVWQLIWEYYLRCEMHMNLPGQAGLIKTKMFESSFESLVTQDSPN
jgi:hypothetical protein